jgi:hypothetical protein
MTFIGHLYTNYRKLKAYKEKKVSRGTNPPQNKKQKGQKANEVIVVNSNED